MHLTKKAHVLSDIHVRNLYHMLMQEGSNQQEVLVKILSGLEARDFRGRIEVKMLMLML